MKVQGVDPVIINTIQERTRKAQVQDTEKVILNTEQERGGQDSRGGLEESLGKAVEQLNQTAEVFNISIRFKVDRETDELYVLVLDEKEGKVIRSIPPEKILDAASQVGYMIGLMVDELI
jgi:flagellar protein FlaG